MIRIFYQCTEFLVCNNELFILLFLYYYLKNNYLRFFFIISQFVYNDVAKPTVQELLSFFPRISIIVTLKALGCGVILLGTKAVKLPKTARINVSLKYMVPHMREG